MSIVEKKYLMMGAAAAGLVFGYAIYRGVWAVGGAGLRAVEAINPLNNDNIVNQGVTDFYQFTTGSTGSIGTDIYDATHGGALDVRSQNNYASRAAEGAYAAITGSKGSIGTDIYDGVDAVEKWIKGWW